MKAHQKALGSIVSDDALFVDWCGCVCAAQPGDPITLGPPFRGISMEALPLFVYLLNNAKYCT